MQSSSMASPGPPGGIVPVMPSAASGWQAMQAAQKVGTPTQRPRLPHSAIPMNGGPVPPMNRFPQGGVPYASQPPSHRVVIPTLPQAWWTMYASRLRSGSTLLVQPISTTSQMAVGVAVGPGTHTPAGAASRSTRGRGAAINYTEAGSGDEFEEPEKIGPIDSDDSDFHASGGTRTMVRKMGRGPGSSAALNAKLAAANALNREPGEAEKSHLGSVPPLQALRASYVHSLRVDYQSPEKIASQAELPTVLIPIRIELDTENSRIRDCFTWNLNESLITPHHFARLFCADLGLENIYVEQITNQIRAQLEEHGATAALDLPTNTEREDEILHEDDAGPGDCRVVLQIDVQIGTKHMLDHIEWDLRSSLTPEEFTTILCADVGLSSEAKPMIAHAIHEELLKHKKDVIEWGVLEGGGEWKSHAAGLGNAWGRKGKGPKRMKGIWRDWAEIVNGDYAPRIEELTVEELEKKELERERAARRLRRETSKFQGTGVSTRRRR